MKPRTMDLPYLVAARPYGDAERGPVAVSVLVASRDPAIIAEAGPQVARALYPGRTFGRVLNAEPVPTPQGWAWSARATLEWSAVDVEETSPCPIP